MDGKISPYGCSNRDNSCWDILTLYTLVLGVPFISDIGHNHGYVYFICSMFCNFRPIDLSLSTEEAEDLILSEPKAVPENISSGCCRYG